jgi:hypothetical protein
MAKTKGQKPKNAIKLDTLDIEKEVVKKLLDIAMEYGQEKKGAFFIITSKDIRKHYKLLYPDIFHGQHFNIKEPSTFLVVKKLAELDGAIIVDEDGNLVAYGAEISKTMVYKGHGTRHSAALGVSQLPETIAITSSEEDGAVRVFRSGLTLVEINPFTKTPPTLSERVADLITSSHIPLLGGGGLASIALGLNPLVAAIIFTGSYIATKSGVQSLGDFLRKKERKAEV